MNVVQKGNEDIIVFMVTNVGRSFELNCAFDIQLNVSITALDTGQEAPVSVSDPGTASGKGDTDLGSRNADPSDGSGSRQERGPAGPTATVTDVTSRAHPIHPKTKIKHRRLRRSSDPGPVRMRLISQ